VQTYENQRGIDYAYATPESELPPHSLMRVWMRVRAKCRSRKWIY